MQGRRTASMASPSRPWKGKEVTRDTYLSPDGQLHEIDDAHFCAAGALLWHANGGQPQMLLAAERREATRGGRTSETGLLMAFNFLGGKRDSVSERPRAVAARECWEETGEQLSAAARKRLETTAQPL